jgi:fructokinase
MIVVIGEALIDLVVTDAGVTARPGGAAFNTARTLARLGAATTFLGGISGDGFGRTLRDCLTADGVREGLQGPPEDGLPSTLAVVDIGAGGVNSYTFYLAGTAAAALTYPQLTAALPAQPTAVHLGSLGLVMEPIGSAVARLAAEGIPQGTLLMVDPNCRPSAITNRDAYTRRLAMVIRRADILKASTEDLAYLMPNEPPDTAARALAAGTWTGTATITEAATQAPTVTGTDDGGPLVIVTDGPHPVRAVLPGGGPTISVQAPPVKVVDTIGAGDALGGAFLAWWLAAGLGRVDRHEPEQVRAALHAAAWVAALTCTRPGADPPHRADLPRAAHFSR